MNLNKKHSLVLMLGGLLAACQLASATSVNITVKDPAPGQVGGIPWGFGTPIGPFSTNVDDGEDNETEQVNVPSTGTVRSQAWDVEAFSMRGTGSGPVLSLVGGFDFLAGEGGYRPGHLFIKVGGLSPDIQPTTYGGPGTGAPIANGNLYGYAVDLATGTVYKLDAASMVTTVVYDQLGSNPWTYSSGAVSTTTTTVTVDMNKSVADTVTITGESSLGTLAGETGDQTHNIVQVNLSFLGAVNPADSIYFHYTMECGNDVIKGRKDNGFLTIPDGGGSLMLLGMGLCSLFAVGRRQAVR